MGMIEIRLGEGTFVCARSEFLSRPLLWAITTGTGESLHELVEVRQLMEVELASLASERATVKDLKAIREQIQRMEKATHEPEVYLDADLHFHLAVARAAHNSILTNALELIRNLMKHDLMGRWIKESLRQDNTGMRALEEHRRIFEAISNGDRATAREVMTEHMKNLGKLYSDRVRTHEPAAWLLPGVESPIAGAGNLSDQDEKPVKGA
jgi:GntR family transcriptional repressor for pyruvate dehydrogenase complex